MSEASNALSLVPQFHAPDRVRKRSLTWYDVLEIFGSDSRDVHELPYPLLGEGVTGQHLEGVTEPGKYQRNAYRRVTKHHDTISCKAEQPEGTCTFATGASVRELLDPKITISFWYKTDEPLGHIVQTEHKAYHELAQAWLTNLKEQSQSYESAQRTDTDTPRYDDHIKLTSDDGIIYIASRPSKIPIAEIKTEHGEILTLYGELGLRADSRARWAGEPVERKETTTKGVFSVQAFRSQPR
ncbi:hypothetical protein Q5752_000720 [Cryptotrichosporon argae]